MTPLPAALGGKALVAWRIDAQVHAATWDSGEGSFRFGGRWNSAGVRAVYCSFDPSTTIVEVAVHKGFDALDVSPHMLSEIEILEPKRVHIVDPADVPNPGWLRPGMPSAGQQRFGDKLLADHAFVAIPSAVSTRSWNIVFTAARAAGTYRLRTQERFSLDTRLNPPAR